MANKKVFTDESLATFVDEIKAYTDESVSTKANSSHSHTVSDITDNAGKSTTGIAYSINDASVTAKEGAEIFNDYTNNIATGQYSHAEGYSTIASGDWSHAEGYLAQATGMISHAEGYNAKATGGYSHAEGQDTTASGAYSHAEGYGTTASNDYAHAEGHGSVASGLRSHAEGASTASGNRAHSEGNATIASGENSHAEGLSTKASSENQHVQGKYNIEDTTSTYAHIVGNGTNTSKRSNAHTLDWSGNAWFAGDAYVGGTSQSDAKQLATQEYVDGMEFITIEDIDTICGRTITIATMTITDNLSYTGATPVGEITYEVGMTWREWCVSEYNTYGMYCAGLTVCSSDGFVLSIHSMYGDIMSGIAAPDDPIGGQKNSTGTISSYAWDY